MTVRFSDPIIVHRHPIGEHCPICVANDEVRELRKALARAGDYIMAQPAQEGPRREAIIEEIDRVLNKVWAAAPSVKEGGT